MRHPFWIINSTLLFFALVVMGFIFLSRQQIPAREDIEPEEQTQPIDRGAAKINISKIYQDDLFNTYQEPLPEHEQLQPATAFPQPPVPRPSRAPRIPAPNFLDPLNITLKGIIAILDDETKNRAIIADNNTNQENVYKVQDSIEDSQLIRIFSNKIILLRSNGQQEVLYLREQDAKIDASFGGSTEWQEAIQKISDYSYRISPHEFISQVKNLAQFIDMLDLTTVYEKGKSVGVRIGDGGQHELRNELGLQKGDVVLTIDNMSAATNTNRLQIYKTIINMQADDVVVVQLNRGGETITMRYILQDFKTALLDDNKKAQEQAVKIAHEERLKILKQQHKVAPTTQDIRMRERRNMMQRGRSPLKDSIINFSEQK